VTRVVGLTGGIGTGKSTVSTMLAELGAAVIDSDAIVHELQAPGQPLLAELAAEFGPGILRADGSLDRAALGDLVFRDETARKRLNAIVHPAVGRESAQRLAQALANGVPLVVLDIPLLFETRMAGTASKANLGIETIVVVWAPRELQIERQLARNGYGRDEAERRVDSQIPIDEKRARAHHVIDNSGSLEDTQRQVRELYALLTAPA
jgi:dephospho-CoA kinase